MTTLFNWSSHGGPNEDRTLLQRSQHCHKGEFRQVSISAQQWSLRCGQNLCEPFLRATLPMTVVGTDWKSYRLSAIQALRQLLAQLPTKGGWHTYLAKPTRVVLSGLPFCNLFTSPKQQHTDICGSDQESDTHSWECYLVVHPARDSSTYKFHNTTQSGYSLPRLMTAITAQPSLSWFPKTQSGWMQAVLRFAYEWCQHYSQHMICWAKTRHIPHFEKSS